ncbi:glutaredoxin 3 [Anaeromyxobacter paludicola]|uniref:Glutaredoxin n=1 Tax=Anaeromyxobacter paludicola TaxID=2918171 RepID=A0ABM7X6B2_9BACT|nr:glutaredoxin 3 [Anaeromyxobacter paludicola]BDG07362.1 glutaredoxin 3 [Anaeromyxobacter paludicola]
MVDVEIYTKKVCPYCTSAKRLLDKKGVRYAEVDVEDDDAKRLWLVEVTGQRTVPQIFAAGKPLGGFSDIDALDKAGRLDPILRGEASPPVLPGSKPA